MALALEEARKALAHDDVPVGAVVLINGEVAASRHNEREKLQDPTAHAEILALRDAARIAGSWRLGVSKLIVTLEPCLMCAGAAVSARIGTLIFGALDSKAGAVGSLYNVCSDTRLNHRPLVVSGLYAEESSELLTNFFATKRAQQKPRLP